MTSVLDGERFEEAKRIWRTLVPAAGPAETVQGELLRAVEKLRWEAQNNGNNNWDDDFERLIAFVARTLLGESAVFDHDARQQLTKDLESVGDGSQPVTEDEPFDRIVARVVDWCRSYANPIPHHWEPPIHR